MEAKKSNWHRLTAEETLRGLGSRADGLSGREAGARLRRQGCNRLFDLPVKKDRVARKLITDPSLWLFVAIAILALGFAEPWGALPALLLFGVWLCIVIWRSARIHRSMEMLGRCGIPTVNVLRNRKLLSVSARNVVVGDVLLLRRGDIVPGDCRLLSSSDLQIRFWDCKAEKLGKKTVMQSKNADTVYAYPDQTCAPDRENILYAGSEIAEGTAKAVIFALGEDTFAGELGVPLRRDRFDREVKQISRFLPSLRLVGLGSLILLFPMGLLVLLIAPREQSGMRAFLPVCAWALSMAWALPYCYLHGIVHRGVRGLFQKNARKNGSLIQSERAVDALPCMTDLFVLGRGAISDGRMHFHAAFTGEGVFVPAEERSAELQQLCEACCLLEDALARFPRHLIPTSERQEPYLAELIDAAEFDRESLSVRVSKTELYRGKSERILDVESTGGAFRLRFYETIPSMLSVGEYLRGDGSFGLLDGEKRRAYREFVDRATQGGGSVITVLKEFRGSTRFVGCLVKREAFLRDLSGALAELEQSGVCVRLFFDRETPKTLACAGTCMPDYAARRAEDCSDPSVATEKERVFFGYSDKQIVTYIKGLRKQGRVVGTVSCDADWRCAMAASSVSIGCDLYSSNDGDSECEPILQRDSDLLIAGASSSGGGLSAIGQSIRTFKQTWWDTVAFYERFWQSRLTMTVFMILSIALGMGSLPAYAVLYATLAADLLLLLPAGSEIKNERVRAYDPVAYLTSRKAWTNAVLTPAIVTLLTAIFYRLELLPLSGCYAVLFVSMLLTETLNLFFGEFRCKLRAATVRGLLILWIPVLLLAAASAMLPQISNVTELGIWNGYSAIPLALGVILELFLLTMLPKMQRKGKFRRI